MSSSSSSSNIENSLEIVRTILQKTLPWAPHYGSGIPKLAQIISSSDSDNESLQPFNDFYYSDSSIEDNIDSTPNNKESLNTSSIDRTLEAHQKVKKVRENKQAELAGAKDQPIIGVRSSLNNNKTANFDIDVDSKIVKICDLGDQKIAINCITGININSSFTELDRFVIVYSKFSKSIVLKAKGHLENF